MHVTTVAGPLAAAQVRLVDAHAHLWIAPVVPDAPALMDEAAARDELADFAACASVEGAMVVDCQPGGCGRDGLVLARLAQASGVAIVAATGFHLARYYPSGAGPWAQAGDVARAHFERELREGLDEAPGVRAGVVKAAWTGAGGDVERELMQAALEAARAGEAAVVVHTEGGAAVDRLVALVEASGLPSGRVQLSHMDKRPDLTLHQELASAGYLLGYDTFLRPRHYPERHAWPLLAAMIADGFWRQITLGLDLVDAGKWHVRGGPGLRALHVDIADRLHREGAGPDILHALVAGNCVRLLARVGKGETL